MASHISGHNRPPTQLPRSRKPREPDLLNSLKHGGMHHKCRKDNVVAEIILAILIADALSRGDAIFARMGAGHGKEVILLL